MQKWLKMNKEDYPVHRPHRGALPQRAGLGVQNVLNAAPSIMDANVYRDPDQFEREMSQVFTTHWLIAGRSDSIPNPGDWLTYEGHDQSVVVTRQSDGSLSAFHNVCAHRGTPFVTKMSGSSANCFVCPYHGWAYDTAGELIAVPERGDFDSNQLKTRAMPVSADEWAGWVWINMSNPKPSKSLCEYIGEDILSDLGEYRMEDMFVYEIIEYDVPINYKTIVDGFNEVYHVTELHKVSIEFTRSVRHSTFRVLGDNSMSIMPRPEFIEDVSSSDYDHHHNAICHYLIFPNSIFNCFNNHIQIFQPIPVDVSTTKFLCWELLYKGNEEDIRYLRYRNKSIRDWTQFKKVINEDIAIYDQLKRTKKSIAFNSQILSERENKIFRYHETMNAKAAPGGPGRVESKDASIKVEKS